MSSRRSVVSAVAAIAAVAAVAGGAVVVDTIPAPIRPTAAATAGTTDREEVSAWRAACPAVTNASGRTEAVAAVALPEDSSEPAPGDETGGDLVLAVERADVLTSTGARGEVIVAQPDETATVVAQAEGALAPTAVAVRSGLDEQGEGRGLAAAVCPEPAGVFWFTGVGAEPGRRDSLLLSNPSDSAAVVDLLLYGPDGRITVAGSDGVVVQPGDEARIGIDTLVPDVAAATLKVTTRQGVVAAMVISEEIAGLIPQGSSYIPPAPSPTGELILAGIPAGDAERTLTAVAVTGEATVEVLAVTAAGTVAWPGAERLTILGEATTSLELPAPPDDFAGSIVLRSNSAITAAVRTSVDQPADGPARGRQVTPADDPVAETGWTSAVRPVTGTLALPSADGTRAATVYLVAVGGAVTLEVSALRAESPAGPATRVEVGALRGTTVAMEVPQGPGPGVLMVRRVAGEGAFVAAVGQVELTDDGPLVTTWPGQRLGGRVAIPEVVNAGPRLP